MPHEPDDFPDGSRLRRALETVRRLRARLEELEHRRSEPIAIVGMACRFPGGAHDPESFWRLLDNGVEAITDIPESRLPIAQHFDPDPDSERPDAIYTRRAGLLEDPLRFDAPFFHLSPREALSLDPQHRLVLEVTWEALERAGLASHALRGSRSGVTLGMSLTDHDHVVRQAGPHNLDRFHLSGNSLNFAAGRIAYFLGLEGPAMVVDTACSSSLVAVHQACQSLRAGETDLMIAGGVNVMMSIDGLIMVCKMQMVSPDGHSRTFDAGANGFVRGEGCGVVVLKRLSDARRDGDPIAAVIRGTATNQDGSSSGLTVPNGLAQQALIRRALADAGLEPDQIGYLEAHGTGTTLGDPIEMGAIGEVFGRRPLQSPLVVSSIKPNVGHLESAAGIAGLIKTILTLDQDHVPPHLHLREVNPHISLCDGRLVIPTERTPWPTLPGPRTAGVSSFGASGTNAHVIVQQYEEAEPTIEPEADARPARLFCLSAATGEALGELARRHAAHLSARPLPLAAVCRTVHVGRARLQHRLAVPAKDTDDLVARLQAFAGGDTRAPLRLGLVDENPGGVTFLFPGQGAQYPGMGRRLYEVEPVFREALDRCDSILRAHLPEPLLAVMHGELAETLLGETAYTQPALFAIEYALSCMWRSWGIEPIAVTGHSVGEYVAACVAGVLRLEDALELIACRGRLMQDLPKDGAMAAILTAPERIAEALIGREDDVSIAAINSPTSVVISGRTEVVDEIVERFTQDGVNTRRLRVSHAFHSPLMDPILAEFAEVAAKFDYGEPRIPLISNLTGAEIQGREASTPDYWCRHLRGTVRFCEMVRSLESRGHRVFLEVGPGATLTSLAQETVASPDCIWLPAMRRGRDDWLQALDAAAGLFVHTEALDGRRFQPPGRRVVLPTYPFAGERYEKPLTTSTARASGTAATSPESEAVQNLLYRVEWRERARRSVSPTTADGCWVLLADRGGVAAALRDILLEQGKNAIVVNPEAREPRFEQSTWNVDLRTTDHLVEGWRQLRAGGGMVSAVVSMLGLDGHPAAETTLQTLAADVEHGLLGLLPLCQSLVTAQLPGSPRLWIVSRNAVPASSQQGGVDVAQSTLWGLGRSLALEQPDLWGGLLDLGAEAAADAARRVHAEIVGSDGEDQVAWRGGQRFVPRLVRAQPTGSPPLSLRPDRTYLVTGAFGGLGCHTVRKMVASGARDLILVGRSGAGSPAGAVLMQELEQAGVRAHVVEADLGEAHHLPRLAAAIDAAEQPLAGVAHIAGLVGFEPLAALTRDRFVQMLGPKVTGAWGLHELTRNAELDFFLCFSSIASVWGSMGQLHYSAANHFLDALSHHRAALSLPCVSISFGPWSGGGMLDDEGEAFLARAGIHAMPPEHGMAVIEHLLGRPDRHVVCADIDWHLFKPAMETRRWRPLFDDMAASAPAAATGSGPADGLRQRIAAANPEQALELIVDRVGQHTAKLLGFTDGVPDPDMGLFEMGMDSLASVALRNSLQSDFDVELPATIAFEHPTVRQLAEFVLGEVCGPDPGAPDRTEATAPETTEADDLAEEAKKMTDDQLEQAIDAQIRQLGLE